MKERRFSIIGPLILITIGALFLLANLGYINSSFWVGLIQFWPLILILGGLEIILGRTRRGQLVVLVVGLLAVGGVVWLLLNPNQFTFGVSVNMEIISEPFSGVQSATVELEPGVGELNLSALPADSANWIEGTVAYPNTMQLKRESQVTGKSAYLKLDTEGVGFFFGNSVERWNFSLAPQIPITLKVNAGVGGSKLDLNALNVTQVDLETGVGGLEVVMPSHAGTVTARVNGGVGGLTVLIPQGVPARVRSDTGIGGVSINQTRFPRVGENLYESPDYASATNKIDLNVDSGVGGITIP